MNKKNNFIILDDDKTSLFISEYVIKKYNQYSNINSFTEPEIVLEKIEKGLIDTKHYYKTILFLDINMTIMTAWEFLELFNNFNEKTKDNYIIYLLSAAVRDFENGLKKYPFVKGYFNKPLNLSHLQEIDNNLIR